MNRRDAISRLGVLIGGTLSASTLSGLLAGCSTPSSVDYALQILTEPQFALFGRIANIIIPETDTPGATEAGVDRFIDTMLAKYYPLAETRHFLSLWDAFGMMYSPEEIDDVELETMILREDSQAYNITDSQSESAAWAFRLLKELVISGYYTSEIGMTEELRVKPFGTANMDIARSEIDRTWSN